MFLFLSQMLNTGEAPSRGIHVRFIAAFGAPIRCRIEQLSTGQLFDFDPGVRTFSHAPRQPFGPTVEKGQGLFAMDLPAASNTFPPGDYSISLHDSRIADQAIGLHLATLS